MKTVGIFVFALFLAVAGLIPSEPSGASAQVSNPELALAQKFAPIAYLRKQDGPCDRRGAAFFPAPVDFLLDNPEVALKRIGEVSRSSAEDPIVKMAPSAQDLAAAGSDFYLDFPGDPRRPGCTYEQDFDRFVAVQGVEPTTYARVVVDDQSKRVALQYWFFYYFNDWNNTHEGDWERIQLQFDATSAEEALNQTPSEVAYAQHGGGELADWGDDKLQKEGLQPLVYPAVGAQASFYDQQLYIGWGENGTGFGCDDTTAPSERVPLDVVLMPSDPTADGEFAWLLFPGRWGERQPWEFNGPLGPANGTRWSDPVASTQNWRSFSLYIPGSTLIPRSATHVFCDLTMKGAQVVTRLGTNRGVLIGGFFAILAAGIYLLWVNRKVLNQSLRIIGDNKRTFIGLGLLVVPISALVNTVAILLSDEPPLDFFLRWFNDQAGAYFALAVLFGGIQLVLAWLVITPPLIEAVRQLGAGDRPTIRSSIRGGYEHVWPYFVSLVLALGATGLLSIFFWTWPVAIWLSVRWLFNGQATVLDDAPNGRSALRRSSRIVQGRWFRTLKAVLAFELIALLPGPLIGLALLVLGHGSIRVANLVAALAMAVTLPISIVAFTLIYQQLATEENRDEVPDQQVEAVAVANP